MASASYTTFAQGFPVTCPLKLEVLGSEKFRWDVDTPNQGFVTVIVSGTAACANPGSKNERIPVGEIPGKTFETFPVLALDRWATSSSYPLLSPDDSRYSS